MNASNSMVVDNGHGSFMMQTRGGPMGTNQSPYGDSSELKRQIDALNRQVYEASKRQESL